MDQLQSYWYDWGVFIAFTIALLTVFGIFFDAQRRQLEALLWKIVSVLAAVLIFPSVVLSIVTALQKPLAPILIPLALLGVLATVLALASLPLYALGIGTSFINRCPNCGKPRDPSWSFCPYCQYDKPGITPAAYEPTPAFMPPSPSPSMQPTQPAYIPPPPTPLVAPAPPTEVMGPSDETGARPQPPPTRLLHTAPPVLAYLVIQTGVHQGKAFQLSETTNIGRKADVNDIVLDDDAVSRQHARVRLENGKFVLYDLASANGTFVRTAKGEWERIQKRPLANGMSVKIGGTVLVFMHVKTGKEE